ncbi:MAG: hypothetical protein ACYSVY_09360, partial [Planctomycetota bacterium]
ASFDSDPGLTDNEAAKPFGTLPPDAPRVHDVEPNDSLTEPTAAAPQVAEGFFIDGRLKDANDKDVFELGPVIRGDMIAVQISTARNVFLAAALFDGRGRLLARGSLQSAQSGNELSMSHVARTASPGCALAVVAYNPRFNAVGDYEAAVIFEPDQPVPPPSAQRVLLNFDGQAAVPSASFADVEIIPFDAGAPGTATRSPR